MNKLINILNQGGHLVVTSRQISDDFEKEHRNVVRDIETLIANIGGAQNCADLFIEAEYQHPQNKQFYKEYLLTLSLIHISIVQTPAKPITLLFSLATRYLARGLESSFLKASLLQDSFKDKELTSKTSSKSHSSIKVIDILLTHSHPLF